MKKLLSACLVLFLVLMPGLTFAKEGHQAEREIAKLTLEISQATS